MCCPSFLGWSDETGTHSNSKKSIDTQLPTNKYISNLYTLNIAPETLLSVLLSQTGLGLADVPRSVETPPCSASGWPFSLQARPWKHPVARVDCRHSFYLELSTSLTSWSNLCEIFFLRSKTPRCILIELAFKTAGWTGSDKVFHVDDITTKTQNYCSIMTWHSTAITGAALFALVSQASAQNVAQLTKNGKNVSLNKSKCSRVYTSPLSPTFLKKIHVSSSLSRRAWLSRAFLYFPTACHQFQRRSI